MRYAIIGTGAIGGFYGGRLARAGFDVHFLLHSDFEYVRDNGLRVDSYDGSFVISHPQAYASYRAQNEAYKGGDGEKRRKTLPIKELCVMAASGRTKRNVYIGLHDV